MLDNEAIIEQYKTILGSENGFEAAERFLKETYQDTTVPEEVSKEIEVYLMKLAAEAEANETTTSDESVTAEPVAEVEQDTTV